MELTKEQLKEIYDQLPEDLKNSISSVDEPSALFKIYQDYDLHIDQLESLSKEVGLILFGINRPEDFGQKIKAFLPDEKVGPIIDRVNKEVFGPVQNSLKEAQLIHAKYTSNLPKPDVSEPADAQPTESRNIFAQKRTGVFAMPSEHKEVKALSDQVADPYREPVE